jgi:hypothetical protein
MSDINNTFSDLHKALAEDLLARVRSGQATAAELNVARQMLKDNGIEAVPVKDSALDGLAKILPFSPDDMKQYGS